MCLNVHGLVISVSSADTLSSIEDDEDFRRERNQKNDLSLLKEEIHEDTFYFEMQEIRWILR
jgi:hypothetical protein